MSIYNIYNIYYLHLPSVPVPAVSAAPRAAAARPLALPGPGAESPPRHRQHQLQVRILDTGEHRRQLYQHIYLFQFAEVRDCAGAGELPPGQPQQPGGRQQGADGRTRQVRLVSGV